MKKPLSLLLIGTLFLGCSFVSATSNTDTQLLDQIVSWSNVSASSLKFKQATSCETIQEMLKKYAKERAVVRETYTWWTPMLEWAKGISVTNSLSDSVQGAEASLSLDASESISSSSTDYSTTNIQKAWVDEPEIIIKDNGELFKPDIEDERLTYNVLMSCNSNKICI